VVESHRQDAKDTKFRQETPSRIFVDFVPSRWGSNPLTAAQSALCALWQMGSIVLNGVYWVKSHFPGWKMPPFAKVACPYCQQVNQFDLADLKDTSPGAKGTVYRGEYRVACAHCGHPFKVTAHDEDEEETHEKTSRG
jgi:hypothetical protein